MQRRSICQTPVAPQAAERPAAEVVAEAMPAEAPAIRTIAMPADTNPSGDIFGGWLMCQMDLAGGYTAARCAGAAA